MRSLEERFPRYSKLLRLYPAAYRKKYGEQMLQTLADMLDDTSNQKASVWFKASLDIPFSLVRENAKDIGGIMAHDMPGYIKRSSVISGLLLTPFFVLIALSSVTSHHLYNTVFWQVRILFTWLIVFPALAILISGLSYSRWLRERRQQNKGDFWRNLFDLRHTWPMIIVAGVAFGIIAFAYGHDSVHCVVGNPIREARNWHQTWQCIKQG